MTVEEKVLEVALSIVEQERDQLKERVRELEAAKAKYENMLSALLIHGQPKGQLEERIAKAKAILNDPDWDHDMVRYVLKALEGK